MFPKLVIDPVKPLHDHLYDSAYEHKKEVWGHKGVKDFIISYGNNATAFTKTQIKEWFEPSLVPEGKFEFKEPLMPIEKSSKLLDYINSMIVNQVDYILDTIEK